MIKDYLILLMNFSWWPKNRGPKPRYHIISESAPSHDTTRVIPTHMHTREFWSCARPSLLIYKVHNLHSESLLNVSKHDSAVSQEPKSWSFRVIAVIRVETWIRRGQPVFIAHAGSRQWVQKVLQRKKGKIVI